MNPVTDELSAQPTTAVRVAAYYPSAAGETHFHADLHETLQQVVTTAYGLLQEMPRPGDTVYCHHKHPGQTQTDLTPYLLWSLERMVQEDVCIHVLRDHSHDPHYELAIDIDAETGGAYSIC